jgi:hypothetical protein
VRSRILGSLVAAAATLTLTLTPAGGAVAAGTATIQVPSGFDPAMSDTRATGHYEVQGTGLHIWTEGSTSTDKVAEYVDTNTPLADVGDPKLNFDNTSGGGVPGFQLVVDFNNDGQPDGILVGEPGTYGDNWWLSNDSQQWVKDQAPHTGGGQGSPYYGTLQEWQAAFPDANVLAFGFSLGSGVKGDGVLNSIEFAGTTYTFAPDEVTLSSKDQCKNGGWKSSTDPVYRNQGQCVSHFASAKSHRH